MKIRATWKKRIWGMALALCITLPALAQPALAAEEYIPGNPRWSGYKNQVQWDKPENAGSSDSFEYEAQLLLEGEVLENQTSEIQPYVFFSSDTVTPAAGGIHHPGACPVDYDRRGSGRPIYGSRCWGLGALGLQRPGSRRAGPCCGWLREGGTHLSG